MPKKYLAHFCLLLVALFYGGNYSIAKLVLDPGHIGPNGFIALRVACGSVAFWLLHRFFVREKIERRDIGRIVLCAMLGVVINMLFFFQGLKLTTPINAALLMTTVPILVLLTSSFLLKERITLKKLLGIAVGATGAVILIIYGNKFAYRTSTLLGDLMVFANAVSYGFYIVLMKQLTRKYHPLTIVKWIFPIGLIILLPVGWQDLQAVSWSTLPPVVWFSIGYVLLLATVGTYALNPYALSILSASTVSIYIYLQPLFAAVISISLAQEEFHWTKATAAACIFFGVYLVSSNRRTPTSTTHFEKK